jgi:hypothetical protein
MNRQPRSFPAVIQAKGILSVEMTASLMVAAYQPSAQDFPGRLKFIDAPFYHALGREEYFPFTSMTLPACPSDEPAFENFIFDICYRLRI